MATIDADELEFCVDCVMLIANGEVFDSDGNDIGPSVANAQTAIWGTGINGAMGLVLNSHCKECIGEEEACEGWFSWSSCDGCGSTLGGDRQPGAHIVS